MSTDLELEEFNGLGTTLAPRIPNAENRNLEAKVLIINVFFLMKSFSLRSRQNNDVFN
jgi:hypothetical protein